jgi:hypothetical protein
VRNGALNKIKTPIKTKILETGPLALSSKAHSCVTLDVSTIRGDHTHGIFNNKVLTVIIDFTSGKKL